MAQNRKEFTRKVRAEIFARSKGACEDCGARLKVGEGEIDHVVPDAQKSYDPNRTYTAEDGKLLCRPCHKAKTASDIRTIRKTDRQRDKHSGAWKKRGRALPGTKRSGIKVKIGGGWEYR